MSLQKNRPLRPNVQKALEELRTNPSLQPIVDPPLRPVTAIQFGVLSPDEIQALSVCEVKNSRVAQPPTDTVYDERMGPAHSRGLCSTCNEDIRVCPGHFGHITLAAPIIHPMFLKFIVTILNCICLKCSKLKMNRDEIDLEINVLEHDRYIRYIDRLNIIVKKCASVAYCNDCTFPYPDVKEIEGQIFKVYDATKKTDKTKKSRLEISELRTILSKITTDDLTTMGFQPQERKVFRHGKVAEVLQTFRPEWLILTHLPVIPPMSRPPDNEGDNRSDDDLTTSYTDIIKYNERLKEHGIKQFTYANLLVLMQKHVKGLFDNSDGAVTRSSGKVAKGIKERITGKNGHIRGKLMGKRVDCSARTVITADPHLYLNEVGVPEEIARTLSFPEKVTPRNINELKQLLDAGKVNTIIRNSQIIRVPYAVQAGRVLKLRYGDIAHRQLRDKDTVVFNRQPTLHRGSMMAHYVRVLPGKTFRLNLAVTKPYNADFDGDEMQAHIPQDYGAVTEVQMLMGVNKMIVSPQASRPIMGVIQDSLLGVYLLTHPDVQIPRHQFMDCVFSAGEKYVEKLPSLFQRAREFYGDDLFNGRVLFSILLPENLQFEKVNNAYKEEPKIIIKNGILIKGVVEKAIVGSAHSSIIHRLYKEYNDERSAEFLSAVQFIVNRWLMYRGFSVSVADFVISEENERGVQMAIQKAYIEVETIQESDDSDQLKEFRINSALNNRGQALAINGLCKNNRLNVMIDSGSKGSKMNVIQIAGHLGQNNVEGRRIQPEIDDGTRTLPCFERGDTHPRTRGFIENSFLKGLTPYELWFHTKAGREGVINTAVKTRDSGYAERKLVKRMEDMTVHNDCTVRNSVNNIVSFSYGDSLDPTMVYENNNGPSFIDIDNIVARLNADVPVEPDFAQSIDILKSVRNTKRHSEVVQSIAEYRASISVLKSNTTAIYKKMLGSARTKLRELLAEKKVLESE